MPSFRPDENMSRDGTEIRLSEDEYVTGIHLFTVSTGPQKNEGIGIHVKEMDRHLIIRHNVLRLCLIVVCTSTGIYCNQVCCLLIQAGFRF